jgi:hypothetical protein
MCQFCCQYVVLLWRPAMCHTSRSRVVQLEGAGDTTGAEEHVVVLQARIASDATIKHIPPEQLEPLRSRPELHTYDPLPFVEGAPDAVALLRQREQQRTLLHTALYCAQQLLTHEVRILLRANTVNAGSPRVQIADRITS